MALTIRITAIDITDPDGTGPLLCSVNAVIDNTDPATSAVGLARASDSRQCVLGRAAYNALLNAIKRPSGDAWPDGTLPHPIQKLP